MLPVLREHASVDLVNLWLYGRLLEGANAERQKLQKTLAMVNNVLAIQTKVCDDLVSEVNRLKREIRLITKGVPVTEPLDPASSQPVLRSDPNFNQQQYDAHTVLLKKAYRMVAQIAHPDKGGTQELFDEVREAYAARSLEDLTHIYLMIQKGRNLYWQASSAGVEHVSMQMERPHVMSQRLKTTPVFEIARLHLAGKVEQATSLMRNYLTSEIAALMNEINYLGARNG